MTAKEKAQELIDKFSNIKTPSFDVVSGRIEQVPIGHYSGMDAALICADEIILEAKGYRYKYWQDVKQELKKL